MGVDRGVEVGGLGLGLTAGSASGSGTDFGSLSAADFCCLAIKSDSQQNVEPGQAYLNIHLSTHTHTHSNTRTHMAGDNLHATCLQTPKSDKDGKDQADSVL